jgi:arginyl-tRNA synthetase
MTKIQGVINDQKKWHQDELRKDVRKKKTGNLSTVMKMSLQKPPRKNKEILDDLLQKVYAPKGFSEIWSFQPPYLQLKSTVRQYTILYISLPSRCHPYESQSPYSTPPPHSNDKNPKKKKSSKEFNYLHNYLFLCC